MFDPFALITAGANLVTNTVSGGLNLASNKRAGEAAADVARMNYLASLNQSRTAGKLAEIDAENAQKIFLYVVIGLVFIIIVYFITRWAFK